MGKYSGILRLLGLNGFLMCASIWYVNRVKEYANQKLYKSTNIYNEAINTLRSHRGAIHFLGETIEDGNLRILEEKEEENVTNYHIKVPVSGTKDKGNMYFWVHRLKTEEDSSILQRIELQLQKQKHRLLILDKSKAPKTQNNASS